MEALSTFLWWLGVAMVCSFVFGTLILAFLLWWCGALEDEEGEDK